MTRPQGVPFGHRLNPAALFCATCLTLLGSPGPAAIAEEATRAPRSLELAHGLEGMRFGGPFAVEGEASPSNDVLVFEDGLFWSRICLEYGFEPAHYWVRRDADGLRFRARAESPENGTIRFEGIFDGEELKATALWTKERWYWTIEQKFVFTGRPVDDTE